MKNIKSSTGVISAACIFIITIIPLFGGASIHYPGIGGPGKGTHVVLIAAEEEYRAEESMPMLGKILSVYHGFDVTVIWSYDDATGFINPDNLSNIPGLKILESADLLIMYLRHRELPDSQMVHLVNYFNSDKPLIGIRTSSHAFRYVINTTGPYAKYSRDNTVGEWALGFGQRVLGSGWKGHWGGALQNSTTAIVSKNSNGHKIVAGMQSFWGHTDTYRVPFIDGNHQILMDAIPLSGMNPDDPPMTNDTVPLAWLRDYEGEAGKTSKVFSVSMGGGEDFKVSHFRRLLVNSVYWLTGLEEKITETLNVDFVDPYEPQGTYLDGHFLENTTPQDFAIKADIWAMAGCMDTLYLEYDSLKTVHIQDSCISLKVGTIPSNVSFNRATFRYTKGQLMIVVPVEGRYTIDIYNLNGVHIYGSSFVGRDNSIIKISLPLGIYHTILNKGMQRIATGKFIVI